MNKKWIEWCQTDVDFIRANWFDISTTSSDRDVQFSYLIAIGLFESAWLFHDKQHMDEFEDDFGYPNE